MQSRCPGNVMTVAVICLFCGAISILQGLVLLAGAGGAPVWMDVKRVDALNALQWLTLMDGIILVVCGINFMQAANWARWLFVGYAIASCAVSAVLLSDKLEYCGTTFGFFAICTVFLFVPNANDYFSYRRRR